MTSVQVQYLTERERKISEREKMATPIYRKEELPLGPEYCVVMSPETLRFYESTKEDIDYLLATVSQLRAALTQIRNWNNQGLTPTPREIAEAALQNAETQKEE